MKILILTNNDVGLYKFRKELLEKLRNDGHKVYVSLPDGEFISDIRKIGCKVICTQISRRGMNPIEDLKLLSAYLRLLKKIKPDMVFTYTIKPNVYGGIACSLYKIPYVMNITGLGTAVETPGVLQLLTVGLYRLALWNVQTIFFQNKENEAFFTRKKLALGKHKMLPGSGVNLDYYKVMEYIESETVDFVFVARIMKEKGAEQYFEAARYIHKKYPHTRFHVCGFCEENYEEELNNMQVDGTVIYHGLVKDMRKIYQQVHCTVHPTYYPEGLSNVLLESAASGRPIITTNRSGCREVIEDGKNGFLVKEQDSADLIQKIEKFLALSWEERKTMGLAGRTKVEKEFDRKIVVEKYIKELGK